MPYKGTHREDTPDEMAQKLRILNLMLGGKEVKHV